MTKIFSFWPLELALTTSLLWIYIGEKALRMLILVYIVMSIIWLWLQFKNLTLRSKLMVSTLSAISIYAGLTASYSGFIGFILFFYSFLLLSIVQVFYLLIRNFNSLETTRVVPILIFTTYLGCLLLTTSNTSSTESSPINQNGSISEQLMYMYNSDNEDRLSGIWIFHPSRDKDRLEQTLRLIENAALTPEDKYHSAYILQHGTCDQHYLLAYKLSKDAYNNGIEGAEKLMYSAYDRYLLSTGRYQEYNTQFQPVPLVKKCKNNEEIRY